MIGPGRTGPPGSAAERCTGGECGTDDLFAKEFSGAPRPGPCGRAGVDGDGASGGTDGIDEGDDGAVAADRDTVTGTADPADSAAPEPDSGATGNGADCCGVGEFWAMGRCGCGDDGLLGAGPEGVSVGEPIGVGAPSTGATSGGASSGEVPNSGATRLAGVSTDSAVVEEMSDWPTT